MDGSAAPRHDGVNSARAAERSPSKRPMPIVHRDESADAQFDSMRFEANDLAFIRSAGRAVGLQPLPCAGSTPDVQILLNQSGDCQATFVTGRTVRIPARSFFVVRDGEIKQYQMPGAFRHVVLRTAHDRLSPNVDRARKAPSGLFCASSGYARAFFECASDVSPPHPPPPPADAELLTDAVLSLLALALKERGAEQPCSESVMLQRHRERALAYVRANLHDPLLGVPRMAEALGLSARYLHRLFERNPMSLMEIVWCERTERCAEALLAFPQKTIAEIAFAFGFSDQAHFNRRFRARFGRSPREFVNAMARGSGPARG
jgi:AraC-like DNA-binding protein